MSGLWGSRVRALRVLGVRVGAGGALWPSAVLLEVPVEVEPVVVAEYDWVVVGDGLAHLALCCVSSDAEAAVWVVDVDADWVRFASVGGDGCGDAYECWSQEEAADPVAGAAEWASPCRIRVGDVSVPTSVAANRGAAMNFFLGLITIPLLMAIWFTAGIIRFYSQPLRQNGFHSCLPAVGGVESLGGV